MAGKLSRWTAIGMMVLTLFLIECVYRLAYWLWMSAAPQADGHLASTHIHLWLGLTAISGLLWVCLVWREMQNGKAPKNKGAKKHTTAAR